MIAKIIPLKRLPRGLDALDYTVPDELTKEIKEGQLVRIPFRTSELFGLVLSLEKKSDGALKPVASIVNQTPFVDTSHIKFLQTLSDMYGVSLGTLAKMSLLPLQKRKLKSLQLSEIKNRNKKNSENIPLISYFLYQSNDEHKKYLEETINGTTLILVPETHLIDEVHTLLSIELQQKSVVWHSTLSTKQQFERWIQIRNQEKTIVIGTRGSALLPIPNLKTVIVDYEHDENHKHWDQAPRFHVKDLVPLLGAKIHYTSFSPSCESYYHLAKGGYSVIASEQGERSNLARKEQKGETCEIATSLAALTPRNDSLKLVDLREERRAGRFSLVADDVKETLLTTKGDVFVYINRLGFSTSAGCNDCGYVATCESCTMPLGYHEKTNTLSCHYCGTTHKMRHDCPKCNNQMVQLRGAGTEFIESGVRALLGDNPTHEIVRIDSSIVGELPYTRKPKIIIGTSMAWRHIRWDKTDLIVMLDLDHQLSIPEYLAAEQVWHQIQEVLFRKQAKAKLLIQTFNPDQLVFKSLPEPDRFYRTELNGRKSLSYPPYTYIVRYMYGNEDQAVAKKEAERVQQDLQEKLTKAKKSAKISDVIEMQPRFYRRQYWFTIVVKMNLKDSYNELTWLNSHIPHSWKIDPNPISLLSP